ncbi:MAG: hypothetical protein ABR987_15675 [Terracidiphilus sp.]|jgi:hypothetical protein
MKTEFRNILAIVAICTLLLTGAGNGGAQVKPHAAFDAPGSNAKTDLIIAGFFTAAALVGVGFYFALHHSHNLRGCVVDGPKGMELQTQNGQSFVLFGETAAMKAGEQVKVVGSRQKTGKGGTGTQSFVVERLDRNYGACPAAPAHR